LAVAFGAAHYGWVRQGRGERITGGLARSYYIGVEHEGMRKALCLVPSGLEEGQRIDLQREFALLVRQPVEFPFYVSTVRTTDQPGDLIEINPEQLAGLPPIKTVLRTRSEELQEVLRVHLHANLTEIGTLEVWCSEIGGGRRWKLPFDVRSSVRADSPASTPNGENSGFLEQGAIERGRSLIRSAFEGGTAEAESLVKRLEEEIGSGRFEWAPSLLREFWEDLMAVGEGRARSSIHEARWLNLLGFVLRPGYGMAVDDWRVAQTWRLFDQKIVHEKNELCRAEWWILWRRIAGGLTAGQQKAIASPLLATLRKARSKRGDPGWGTHENAEIWRMLASFELLEPEVKIELGEALGMDKVGVWALGRLGARAPFYGPLNSVVPCEVAMRWADRLLGSGRRDPETYFSLMLLARYTGDRYRDFTEDARKRLLEAMKSAPPHLYELVLNGGELAQEERSKAFGEILPPGLRLI